MSYLDDTIDWQDVHLISRWLDENVSGPYLSEPLAQDWARISKVAEELGEAIQAFIDVTGQNPRKQQTLTMKHVADELADVALTAIYALDHFGFGRSTIMNRQHYHMIRVGLRKDYAQ